MIIHNTHQALVDVADRQGWNEESQIIHLCGFIQMLTDEPQSKVTDFAKYLEIVADEENEGAAFNEKNVNLQAVDPSAEVCPKCQCIEYTTGLHCNRCGFHVDPAKAYPDVVADEENEGAVELPHDSVCENCGAPCDYHSTLILCEKCRVD